MAFRGVRNSWLILAKNSDFRRLSSSKLSTCMLSCLFSAAFFDHPNKVIDLEGFGDEIIGPLLHALQGCVKVAKPVMIMTSILGSISLTRDNTSTPPMEGMVKSVITISNF